MSKEFKERVVTYMMDEEPKITLVGMLDDLGIERKVYKTGFSDGDPILYVVQFKTHLVMEDWLISKLPEEERKGLIKMERCYC